MGPNATELSDLIIAERATLVRSVERIVGNRPDAEEVAQALWLKVQAISPDLPIESKRPFLFRLARNLALDRLRGDRRRARLAEEARQILDEVDDGPSADRIVDSLAVLRRVREAAFALPEPTRSIFRMNRFDGLSQKAIAERMEMSTTTVENHVRRALDALAAVRDGRDE